MTLVFDTRLTARKILDILEFFFFFFFFFMPLSFSIVRGLKVKGKIENQLAKP